METDRGVTAPNPGTSRADGDTADPYAASDAVRKLRDGLPRGSLRIACLDIDSTLTGDWDLAVGVRAELEARGFVVGFITSRTEEMIMTADTFRSTSERGGLERPAPQLGTRNGRHIAVPPEQVESAGVLDGDFLAGSSGTRLFLRQHDGHYLVDGAYEGRYGCDADGWRQAAFRVLTYLRDRGIPGTPASIEDPHRFRTGKSDVYPPSYRIQVNFESLDQKLTFERALRALGLERGTEADSARALWVTDDSHPVKDRWKVFVTPRGGTKAHAAEWLIAHLCETLAVPRHALEVLYVGDSFPDLEMGLLGGLGTRASLLLAGGSRLVEALTSAHVDSFAGRSLRAYRRRLRPTDRTGVLQFLVPGVDEGSRTLVLGDLLFPGTEAVETVYRYVTECLPAQRLHTATQSFPC